MARGTRFVSLFGQAEILPFGPIDDGPPFMAYFASALSGLSLRQEKEIIALDEKVKMIAFEVENRAGSILAFNL